jgi:hypothetical protein
MEKALAATGLTYIDSSDRGYKTQVYAQETCKNLGMKLPTVEQLKEMYINELIPKGVNYWTSQGNVYAIGSILNGNKILYQYRSSYANDTAQVRCVKD